MVGPGAPATAAAVAAAGAMAGEALKAASSSNAGRYRRRGPAGPIGCRIARLASGKRKYIAWTPPLISLVVPVKLPAAFGHCNLPATQSAGRADRAISLIRLRLSCG